VTILAVPPSAAVELTGSGLCGCDELSGGRVTVFSIELIGEKGELFYSIGDDRCQRPRCAGVVVVYTVYYKVIVLRTIPADRSTLTTDAARHRRRARGKYREIVWTAG